MNNSYSEGVLVKNDITGEVLTIDTMVKIIRTEVTKLWASYPKLNHYYEIDDVVQDIVCYYFSPMKKLSTIRLLHYSELYNCSIQYLVNLFRLTSRQWLNMLCRNRDVKNDPISLNMKVNKDSLDGKIMELQDFVKDESVKYDLLDSEFFTDVMDALHKHNFNSLFRKECKRIHKERGKLNFKYTLDDFRNDSAKMEEVMSLTLRQRSFLLDFLDGYTKVELRVKYKDFYKLMKAIKLILKRRVES